MASEPVVLPNLKNALSVFFANFHIVAVIGLVCGGAGFAVTHWAGDEVARASGFSGQSLLVVSTLAQTVFLCMWAAVIGSWAAPAQLYLWVQREKNRPTSLYDAVNFGLNRLPRVLKPHWLAFFFIQLGNLVIVAAILLGLQFAFVDAIATLDDREAHPLRRSGKLTLGRRGTIFRAFLPFLIWWLPYMTAITFFLPEAGAAYQFGFGIVNQIVLCAIDLVMVQLYLDLFRKPATAGVPAAAGAPA